MIRIELNKRIPDSYGEGHFGASRGGRKHRGVDYSCLPNSKVLSPCSGIVSKIGYPYSDDLSFRYIEIASNSNHKLRVFYVSPSVEVGDIVDESTVLGLSQKLGVRYPGIGEHVHLEIRGKGKIIDPETVNPDILNKVKGVL